MQVALLEDRMHSYSRALSNEGLWCRDCTIASGLLPPNKEEPKPEVPLTLEDLIRELVQEEIADSA